MMNPLLARLWRRLEIDDDGCWIWTGKTVTGGYGQIEVNKKATMVHRLMYELRVGPIPEGLTIDHLCRKSSCANPAHLEAVTLRENVLRGSNPPAINARKTHCVHGHEFTPENTYMRRDRPWRMCRECARRATREWNARKKGRDLAA